MKKFPFHTKEFPVTTPTNPVNSMKKPAHHNGSSNKVAPAEDFMQMEMNKDIERSATVTTTTLTDSSFETGVEREHGTSWSATLVNFFKGMIGPGCLSLPLHSNRLACGQRSPWCLFLDF
uniref:Uncharacterized protein n=1 Tax=Ditylenchus dipsaci TaxID=166011 RepID=A0A915CR28_9BILA